MISTIDEPTSLQMLLAEAKDESTSTARLKEILKQVNGIGVDKSAEIRAIIDEIKKIMAARGLTEE